MRPSVDAAATRERIRAVAEDLYVLRGYGGFSFGDIAERGRHDARQHPPPFRQQAAADGGADRRLRRRCGAPASRLLDGGRRRARRAPRGQLDDLRRFYQRFNPPRATATSGARWRACASTFRRSATSRSRALERIDRAYERSLGQAVARGGPQRRAAAATPVEDVARMLRVTLLSCAPMTQDSGSFDEVERLFAALGSGLLDGRPGRALTSRPLTAAASDGLLSRK